MNNTEILAAFKAELDQISADFVADKINSRQHSLRIHWAGKRCLREIQKLQSNESQETTESK